MSFNDSYDLPAAADSLRDYQMQAKVSSSRTKGSVVQVFPAILALTLTPPTIAMDAGGLLKEVRECSALSHDSRSGCFERVAGRMSATTGRRIGPAAADFVHCAELELKRVRGVCFDSAAELLFTTPVKSQEEPARPASGGTLNNDDAIIDSATGDTSIDGKETNDDNNIGNEQLRSTSAMRHERPKRSVAATVVSVHRDPFGLHLFYLDNGQVWQQTERQRFVVPDGDFAVHIREGAISGYRLSLESQNKILRVKRIR